MILRCFHYKGLSQKSKRFLRPMETIFPRLRKKRAGRLSFGLLSECAYAFGPAFLIASGMSGYFFSKLSWNMPASFFACAS